VFELSPVPGTPYRIALRRWEGRGPLLVYLHGIGLSGNGDWPRLMQSDSLAGRASLAVDLLGFGQSPRPQGFSYELADQAELRCSREMAPRSRSSDTAWGARSRSCSRSSSSGRDARRTPYSWPSRTCAPRMRT